jgi:glucose/arabinose dehydrogenase
MKVMTGPKVDVRLTGLSLLPLSLLGAAPVSAQGLACPEDAAGLTLPDGFCGVVVADSVGRARHVVVSPGGDVIVALADGSEPGGVLVLRDTTGDGVADVRVQFGVGGGNDVELHGGALYFARNETILRYAWTDGQFEPTGPADTIVRGLPAASGHRAKSLAFDGRGGMLVNIGSPSNACQVESRTPGSPGRDPCDELETRAGIWRFSADRVGQTFADGERFATGLRHTVALAWRPHDDRLYGVVHGRDQLSTLWPDLFDPAANAELPAEEFVRIEAGDDFGWPYCYYDPIQERKVLAPEYGGDGSLEGRCAEKTPPLIGFPAHWAPNGLHFYEGTQFPAEYAGGAFIAFHGSWNRAPLPQAGYLVAFVPFAGDRAGDEWAVFADGFAGEDKSPRGAAHRPVGIAEGPDGSLHVTDDRGGRVYSIHYAGRAR